MPIHRPTDTTEYLFRVSLRQHAHRQIAVFLVESFSPTDDQWHIKFLDRAVAPINVRVLDEWTQVLNDVMASGTEQRFGVQLELDPEVMQLELTAE